MSQDKKPRPKFLYSPTRVGLKLHVFRHLIIDEDKERIIVQTLIYEWRHEFRNDASVAHLDQSRMDSQGFVHCWGDPWFKDDPSCPLGRLYRTKTEASNALDDWTMITLRRNATRQATRGADASNEFR